ncbi:hypothetical protein [Phormidesmis sp. 146-33]
MIEKAKGLQDFAESYELEGKSRIIRWLLEKVLDFTPNTLRFSAIGTAI